MPPLNRRRGRPGGSRPEADFLAAEPDRAEAGIGEDLDARGYGGGKPEIVGSGHAINDVAGVVTTGNGGDHLAVVGHRRSAGQAADRWQMIEAALDAAQLACMRETLKGLIDGVTMAEIGEIGGRPDLLWRGGHAREYGVSHVGDLTLRVVSSEICIIFRTK